MLGEEFDFFLEFDDRVVLDIEALAVAEDTAFEENEFPLLGGEGWFLLGGVRFIHTRNKSNWNWKI